MEHNFLITDMFNALEKFSMIARSLHKKMRDEEFEEKRFEAAMSIVKKDIDELLAEVGDGS